HSLEIAFLLNLLIAVAVLWQTPDRPSDRWRTVPVGILVGVMAIYALLIPSWNPARFALGVFRNREAPPASLEAYARESVKKEEVVYFQEDLSATVAVLRQTNAEKKTRLSLAVNGKVDASSDTDRPTQLLLAQLPLMLKDRANDVLIIGLGSGMTAGSALTHPVRQVDCIEISPGVAEAARLFGPYNRNALDNPRLRLIVEDAKTYINTTRQQYDIVIIEPSNPWMAGIGNLYSIEFFRDMAQTLKPDGLVVQWFHTYEVSDEVVATAVRTFREVFPYLYIFQGNATDILMVGAQTRIAPDFGRMAEKFALPAVKEELESIGMYDVADLRSFQMISPENVPKITAIGAINTDYRPIIEYRAPLAFFTNAFSNRINEFDERYTQGESLLLHAYLRNHPLDATRLKRLAELFQTRHTGREAIVYPLMSAYLSLVPEDRKIKQTFAEWSLKRKNYGEALRLYRETFDETDARSLESYAEMHYDAQRALHTVFTPQTFDSTFVYLYKALARAPSDEACLLKLGRAALVVGRYEEAFNCFMLALANRKNKLETPDGVAIDEIITQIARAHYHRGNYEAAREHFVGALRENPTNDMATHYFLMTDQMASFREWEKR
ncbi:MAG: methyltransferase domain-containing protein, partial [candidate division Zixibacteria bacterium]|nr:methyltransferase domain-containing protein [candidate division Zixibacteria bacterium]